MSSRNWTTLSERPRGHIDPVHGDRRREAHVEALAVADHLVDAVAIPAAIVLEQPVHEVANVLHAHAARRDEAIIVAENALGGRVVHVDAVRVGDVDAHEAERVHVAARILAEHVIGRFHRVPVHLGWRDLLAGAGEDADLVFRQVVRILLHLGDQILADDRRGDGPERIEVHRDGAGLHDRRLTVDLADACGVVGDDLPVLHRLDGGGGDVHRHVACAQIAREGAQAHEIEFELTQALLHRHVQRGIGLLGDDAGGVDAVARLEAAHAGLDEGIEHLRGIAAAIEVARVDEPLAQRGDRGAADAEAKRGGARHLAPAPVGGHAAIFGDCVFGVLDSLRRQQRRHGARNAQAPVGVEPLAPFGLCAEETILRQRRCGGGAAEPEGKATGEGPAGNGLQKSGHIQLQFLGPVGPRTAWADPPRQLGCTRHGPKMRPQFPFPAPVGMVNGPSRPDSTIAVKRERTATANLWRCSAHASVNGCRTCEKGRMRPFCNIGQAGSA